MDANGQRFFLLADARDFEFVVDVVHDAARRRLRLASARRGPAPTTLAEEDAKSLLAGVPGALDAYGTFAYWDPSESRVRANGALVEPDPAERARHRRREPIAFYPPLDAPKLETSPTDVCLGDDGVVALVIAGALRLVDARDRFTPLNAPPHGVAWWRVAAARGGGFVAIDRAGARVARLTGAPLLARGHRTLPPPQARPCEANPTPLLWTDLPSPALPADETLAAVAMAPDGAVVLLSWAAGGDARVRVLPRDAAAWGAPVRLTAGFTPDGTTAPAPWATSPAFLGADRLAVLVPGLFGATDPPRVGEALVFAWPLAPRSSLTHRQLELLPLGDFYPLTRPGGGPLTVEHAQPLLRGPTGEVGYWTDGAPRPLAPLSKRTAPTFGEARCRVLDSHATGTVWHRLYIEAVIPPGTGVRLRLAADDTDREPNAVADHEFFPHDLGFVPEPPPPPIAPADDAAPPREPPPRAAFVRAASEIPFDPGLLGRAPEAPHAGLFTVLVQRSGRAVRTLAGRRLYVRVELYGTGTHSPEIAAIRVYAPRFSYVERYLPELYAETLFGPDADAPARATGADFLGRFLALVEGELTAIEDRVASAYLLSDPRKTPDEALAWLASWVGLALDPALPVARRRALLRVAPELARRHGTLHGLGSCLDALTGGDVTAGRIVIVEDHRLRRVFATILGAHLEDERDPLLPGGLIVSGNSYVGDTLFLGESLADELAALAEFYREEPGDTDDDDDATALEDRFAHRVTVLIHDAMTPQRRALIDRALALEVPAHVAVRVVAASQPFLVGVAALVGVDSYLAPTRGLGTFRLDGSALGEQDVVRRPPSLDPRLEGAPLEDTP